MHTLYPESVLCRSNRQIYRSDFWGRVKNETLGRTPTLISGRSLQLVGPNNHR